MAIVTGQRASVAAFAIPSVLFVALVANLLIRPLDSPAATLWAGLVILLVVVPSLVVWGAKGIDNILSPRFIAGVSVLIVLVPGLLVSQYSYVYYGEQQIWSAVLLVVAGWATFVAGSVVVKTRRRHGTGASRIRSPDGRRIGAAAVVFLVVSLVWLTLSALRLGTDPLTHLLTLRGQRPIVIDAYTESNPDRYFGWLVNLATPATVLAVCALRAGVGSTPPKRAMLAVIALGSFMTFSSGVRSAIIRLIFTLVFIEAYRRMSHTRDLVMKLVVSGIISIIVLTVLTQVRDVGFLAVDVTKLDLFNPKLVANNIDFFRDIVDVMDAIPDHRDYLYGESLLAAIVFPIPRAWWPNKPEAIGMVMPRLEGTESYSRSLTIFGELYANFGIIGVVVGSFTFGIIAARIQQLFLAHNDDITAQTLYFYFLPYLIPEIRGGFAEATAEMMMQMVPLYVALWWSSRSGGIEAARPHQARIPPPAIGALRNEHSPSRI